MMGAALGVYVEIGPGAIEKQRSFLDGEYEKTFTQLSATIAVAASAAIGVVRANTPVRTGAAKASWSLEPHGPLESSVVSNDVAPKMRWLEGRYRFLARGRMAADAVLKAEHPRYQPPPLSLSPLW